MLSIMLMLQCYSALIVSKLVIDGWSGWVCKKGWRSFLPNRIESITTNIGLPIDQYHSVNHSSTETTSYNQPTSTDISCALITTKPLKGWFLFDWCVDSWRWIARRDKFCVLIIPVFDLNFWHEINTKGSFSAERHQRWCPPHNFRGSVESVQNPVKPRIYAYEQLNIFVLDCIGKFSAVTIYSYQFSSWIFVPTSILMLIVWPIGHSISVNWRSVLQLFPHRSVNILQVTILFNRWSRCVIARFESMFSWLWRTRDCFLLTLQ